MGKTRYILNNLFKINYKELLSTINKVNQETKEKKFNILKDIISCGMKYQSTINDYQLFEMYKLNDKQRQTIVTSGKNKEMFEKYNNPDYIDYFKNKLKFNKKYNKYLLRDWMEITGTEDNYKDFLEFTNKHSEIFVKPTSEKCTKEIEILKVNKKNSKEMYDELLTSDRRLIEEKITQYESFSNLHPYSVNTIKIITLKGEIVACYLRIGNNKNIVDNFDKGGLVAPINIETGIIDYLAVDKDGNTYERHPLTDESILWFSIPKWPRIKRFITQVAKEIPEVGYVGWDVCLGEKDPIIIEGNYNPGHDFYQLPEHRTNGIGLMPIFEKIIKEKEEK